MKQVELAEHAQPVWRRWGPRVAISICDQGLGSGANLVLAVVLARSVTPSSYGQFAVASAFGLFLLSGYAELVTEPMSVLGASEFRHAQHAYYLQLLRLHLNASVALVLVSVIGAMVTWSWNTGLAWALVSAGCSAPFSLLLLTCRRVAYLRGLASLAAIGSAIYGAVVLALLILLWPRHATVPAAFGVIGLASLAAVGFIHRRLSLDAGQIASTEVEYATVARSHRPYVRVALVNGVAHAVGPLLVTPAVAGAVGLGAAGALRAAQNLSTPLPQVIGAITTLLFPWMAQRFADAGLPALRRTTLRTLALLFGLGVPYALVVSLFGRILISFIYGGTSYADAHRLLNALLVAALATAVSAPCVMALRVLQRRGDVVLNKVLTAAINVLVCLPLIAKLGVDGAAWAIVIVPVSEAIILGTLAVRQLG